MSLKDLAAQTGTTVMSAAVNADQSAPSATEAPKTVGDLIKDAKVKTPKAPKVKKEPVVRAKVDDAWIADIVKRANDAFGGKDEYEKATIAFTVAKSKGRYVSLTPKLVYADGVVKSAGPKNRVGFCSNGKWDEWNTSLQEALNAAHTAERKAPTTRKSSGQWAAFATSVKEALGEGVVVKSIAKKLMIKLDTDKVTLRREGNEALVTSASGKPGFVIQVLQTILPLTFS